jgi:hypothetical protein
MSRRSFGFVAGVVIGLGVVPLASCSSGDSGGDSSGPTEVNVDTGSLEQAIADLSAKVDELSSKFVTNEDGSSGFATGTAPAIVTESTYGFAFPLPEGIEPTYVGINDAEATEESGSLLASAGGVSVLLLWTKPETPLSPGDSVTSSFEVLKANSGLDFALLGAGQDAFTVDGQSAAYATFSALDANSNTVGVAVIGGWTCEVDGRAFALTVTGTQEESVSTSFFELVNAFGCEA